MPARGPSLPYILDLFSLSGSLFAKVSIFRESWKQVSRVEFVCQPQLLATHQSSVLDSEHGSHLTNDPKWQVASQNSPEKHTQSRAVLLHPKPEHLRLTPSPHPQPGPGCTLIFRSPPSLPRAPQACTVPYTFHASSHSEILLQILQVPETAPALCWHHRISSHSTDSLTKSSNS